MASVHRQYENAGGGRAGRVPRSKYWYAKFRASDGRIVVRSTRKTDRKPAMEVALQWERDAYRMREGDFTEATYQRNIKDLLERVGLPTISAISAEKFFSEWQKRKAQTGNASEATLRR